MSQDVKDRICQFSGKTAVGGYLDNLVSEGQSQPKLPESQEPSRPETADVLSRGFITVGISAGAWIGYITSGGRRRFLSGGWIDTFIGFVAGMMIGIGLGQLSKSLISLDKKNICSF